MAKGTCIIEGCEKPAKTSGWCGMHYTRWQRTGSTERHEWPAVCSIPDCGNRFYARGWCEMHYKRWLKYGTTDLPEPATTMTWLVQRLASITDDECVVDWPYFRHPIGGYPEMGWKGQWRKVHHVVLELTGHGPKPAGMECRHLCGNGLLGCIHPNHLAWGTSKENSADTLAHGRSNRGERCGSAKLTTADVLAIRASYDTPSALSKRYGVGAGQIQRIRRREQWAWLTD